MIKHQNRPMAILFLFCMFALAFVTLDNHRVYADVLEFSGGIGTAENPYQIASAADLIKLAQYTDSDLGASELAGLYYIQTADIDLTGIAWNPIGIHSDHSFLGNYNGNGYHIINLTMGTESTPDTQNSYAGLFASIDKATVENVHMIGTRIYENSDEEHTYDGASIIGGITGNAHKSIIRNCSNSGTIKSYNEMSIVGGIVGVFDYTTVTGCSNSADITSNTYAFGIGAGMDDIVINNCYNTGTVRSNNIGGIGWAATPLEYCYNSGPLYGNDQVAAIQIVPNEGAETCYYEEGCVKSGTVVTIPGLTALSLEAMRKAESYPKFDFEHTWAFAAGENNGLPVLRSGYTLSVTNAEVTTKTENSVSLSWSSVSGAAIYKIYYRKSSDAYSSEKVTIVNGGSILSGTVTGLERGTEYKFVVRAFSDNNASLDSNECSATTPESYTVAYNLTGGSCSVPTADAQYGVGEAVTLPAKGSMTKANYTFAGWSFAEGGSIISEPSVLVPKHNLTLYAVWTYSPPNNDNPGGNPTNPTPSNPTPSTPGTTDSDKGTKTTDSEAEGTRKGNVYGIDSESSSTIDTVDIVRKVNGSLKTDSVVLDQQKTEEMLKKMTEQSKDTAQIVVDDIKDNPADEVAVTVSTASIKKLSEHSVNLEMKTEEVTLLVPATSISTVSEAGEDLYFRVVPIKDEEQRSEAVQSALAAETVIAAAGNGTVTTLGNPMTIETNYKTLDAKVTFSLKDITIPADEQLRKEFLDSLGIYIKHSDGEQEFVRGNIIYNDNGYPSGIEIAISRFSTFTVISITNRAPVASKLAIIGEKSQGSTLKLSYTYSDKEKDGQGSTVIKWYRAVDKNGKNKVLIKEGKQDTYKVTKKDLGKWVIVEVTPMAKTGKVMGKTVSTAVKIAGKVVSTKSDEVKTDTTKTDTALDSIPSSPSYTIHMKLGLIGDKTYAKEIAAYITKNYQSKNVAVTKEGNYYRVSADFKNKSTAIKACTDMRKKELIINYYVY